MSVSMFANDPRPLASDLVRVGGRRPHHGPHQGDGAGRSAFPRELAVIREMLWALDTLTIPGQRHDMTKVVQFIEGHGKRVLRAQNPRNQRAFAQLLEHLASECERLSPDTRSFALGAENLLTLLAATA